LAPAKSRQIFNSLYEDQDEDGRSDLIVIEEGSEVRDPSLGRSSSKSCLPSMYSSLKSRSQSTEKKSCGLNRKGSSPEPLSYKSHFLATLKQHVWTALERKPRAARPHDLVEARVSELVESVEQCFALRDFRRWSVSALGFDPSNCEKKVREKFYRACDIFEKLASLKPRPDRHILMSNICATIGEVVPHHPAHLTAHRHEPSAAAPGDRPAGRSSIRKYSLSRLSHSH
jgi:hypothetical protein